MKLADLQRFVALYAAGLHVPRAAAALGVSLTALYSSIERLETAAGHELIDRGRTPWALTAAGTLLLDEARRRIADAPATATTPKKTGGGKAKASKGVGRAPIVKGEPKPYKKRQGR